MSTPSIAERVAAGVQWLNANVPGWLERIDLERLMLSNCERCVLGQIYGDYFDAPYGARGPLTAPSLGFELTTEWTNTLRESYADLTAEWRRVIQERRTQAEATS